MGEVIIIESAGESADESENSVYLYRAACDLPGHGMLQCQRSSSDVRHISTSLGGGGGDIERSAAHRTYSNRGALRDVFLLCRCASAAHSEKSGTTGGGRGHIFGISHPFGTASGLSAHV